MDAVKIISSDIDFLIEQFQAIKHERKFELPSEYTEKVRKAARACATEDEQKNLLMDFIQKWEKAK